MRALILLNSSYPIGNVTTHRAHNIAKGLVNAGADVEILITQPTESPKNVNNFRIAGTHDTVNFKFISKTTIRNKNRYFQKIYDLYCYCKIIFNLIRRIGNYSHIIVIGPSLDFRIFIPYIAKFTNSKCLLEVNEFPFIGHKNPILSRFKRFLFLKFILKNYSGLIVISNNLRNYFEQKTNKKLSIIKIPILANEISNFKNSEFIKPIDGPFIFHAGSLQEDKDGILHVLCAFGEFVNTYNSNLKFISTGSLIQSANRFEILKLFNKYNLIDRVNFTGYLDDYQIKDYFAYASLAIVFKNNSIQNQYCFATKLTEYISHSIPIITTNVGEANNYFEDNFNAIVLDSFSVDHLSKKIKYVLDNKEKMNQITRNASKLLIQDFNVKFQGSLLYSFLSGLK
jgi:glycosyltransferase involved in cell wall biosynthesis